MRFLYFCAATALGLAVVCEAPAADNGERLVQVFSKTCAKKPVTAGAMDTLARGLGYSHQNGPVAADDPKRDPDDVHFWKLREQGSNFAIDAYFSGPRAHYQVSCSIKADDIAAAAFLAVLKRETTLPDPQSTKLDPDSGSSTYIWTAEVDGAQDKLEVNASRNGRVRIALTYVVIGR